MNVRKLQRAIGAVLMAVLLTGMVFETAQAGFGITPPYVRNSSLTRNSIYEQQILLVRGDPNTDLVAEVSIDAPEIEEWLTIVEGTEIPLPAGEQKVPMTVRVKVPDRVDYGQYTGKIRIKTMPAGDSVRRGAVNISLGAQVDIDITVIDKVIKDFRVKRISVNDVEEGHKLAWLYFPGKITFKMAVENVGNVSVAPSKVLFKIYDRTGTVLLEETKNTNRFPKVEPFATEDMKAFLPTKLPPGGYIVRYEVYNDDEIKQQGELNMSILPYGSLQTAGYGFIGLSFAHKLSVVLPILVIIIAVLYSIWYIRERRRLKSG